MAGAQTKERKEFSFMGLRDKISNWTRFQHIVAVFARHGFSSVLHELGFAPKDGADSSEHTIPVRLREAFEELGTTFIKLGQLLSTRPDLLPASFIEEFSKLTDQAPSFSFPQVRRILEEEFTNPVEDIFESIESEPIAAASIAQVHRAVLKENGRAVVIKVQRPDIQKTIQSDIQILHFTAKALQKLNEDFRLLNLTGLVEEFQRTIYEELDFNLEAKNISRFSETFSELEGVAIPEVIWSCSSKRVLTMTQLKGQSLSQSREIPDNVDRKFLAESIVTLFFESIFIHGFFHADPHAGNILLNTQGRGQLGLLDFGMVGSIGPELRRRLSKLFLALIARDFESLASAYLEVAEFGKRFSMREFQADISAFLSPQLGRPLRDIPIGQLLLDSTSIARKYRIKLPRDLILFFRCLMALENIGRRLDPDFEFMSYGKKFGQSLIKQRYSSEEIIRDVSRALEGLRVVGTELPSQLKGLLNRLESEEFPFGRSAMDDALASIRHMNRVTALSFLSFTVIMSATLLSSFQPTSVMIWPLWILGACLSIVLLFSSYRKGK